LHAEWSEHANVARMKKTIWLAEIAYDWVAALWLAARRHGIEVLH